MNDSFAYGIDSWYPVVRGGARPEFFVDASDERARRRLRKAWESLDVGGRVVLRASAPVGGTPQLEPLEEVLEGPGYSERFVVFPGTGGSFTLLPLTSGAALRGGMALLPSGRLEGRALWAGLRMLSPFGAARRVGRPEIAIWTKGTPERDSEDLTILPVAGSIAVMAGVPGHNQKVIVRALDRRGAARAILKIGYSERSDDAIAREVDALRTMAKLAPKAAPRLLAKGSRAGRSWLAQEVLTGRRSGDRLGPAHAEFLCSLAALERTDKQLDEVPAYRDALGHLATLEPGFDEDWHAEYTRLADALRTTLDGAPVPVHLAHGDFTPWNVLRRRGEIQAFDWEYFSQAAPALYDAIHFHVQSRVLLDQHPGPRIFGELEAFFRGPVRQVIDAAGLNGPEILRAVGLYILHEGTAAEVQERLRPAPFVQASWLRRARLDLCGRIAGLLLERQLPPWSLVPDESTRAASPPRKAAA